MRKTVIVVFSLMLFAGILYSQETVATGWSKTLELTTHATSPYNPDVLVTDEVSAGWDFDQDGNLEFLVMTDHSNPNGGGDEYITGASLYLYEANASGGFDLAWTWYDTTMITGGASFPTFAVGDLDGDGNEEILLGVPFGTDNPPDGSNPSRFFVFEGPTLPADPTAVWNFGVSVGSNTRPSGMAVGDIDGDGAEEVAVSFRAFSDAVTNDAVMIFSLSGAFAGAFTQWTEELIDTTSNFGSTYAATISDVDGDGMLEAFIPSYSYDTGHFWEGTGTANTYNMYTIGSDPNWLGGLHAVGAFNADADAATEVFVGNGQGNFVVIDGVTDLATADSSDVYKLHNQGTGYRGLAVGDFDDDGNVDVFSGGNYNSNSIRYEHVGGRGITDSASWNAFEIYQQDTSGSMRVYSVAFGGAANNGGTTSDINGDGFGDLFIGFEDGDSTATSYLVVLSWDGTTAIDNNWGAAILSTYKLAQNYPNPFNPTTAINFNLTKAGLVKLNVYDLTGKLVINLTNDYHSIGDHSITWNGLDASGQTVASGTYLYRMEVNGTTLTRQMTLLK